MAEVPGERQVLRFQSSPGPRAGCYAPHRCLARAPRRCFNPHPALGPGATYASLLARRWFMVSILTRPEGRVLRIFARDVRSG